MVCCILILVMGVIVHKVCQLCYCDSFWFFRVFYGVVLVYYGGRHYCSTRWKSIGLAVNTKELKERFRKSVDSKNRTVMRDVKEGRKSYENVKKCGTI